METTTKKPSKSIRKYLDIIESGKIEERELISMRSLMHKNDEASTAIFHALGEVGELSLSLDQQDKGYEFLLGQWKSPTGKERKNNPFGYREQAILENYKEIKLSSLYNAGNAYTNFYLPLYTVYSKDGMGFEYYYNGEINITG